MTIDAMGCQTTIAGQIIAGGRDYLLALKENQKNNLDSVKYLFDWEMKQNFGGAYHTENHSLDKGYGRIETRRTFAIGCLETIEGLDFRAKWPGLRNVAMVESIQELIMYQQLSVGTISAVCQQMPE